jgi:hypothetical protein
MASQWADHLLPIPEGATLLLVDDDPVRGFEVPIEKYPRRPVAYDDR